MLSIGVRIPFGRFFFSTGQQREWLTIRLAPRLRLSIAHEATAQLGTLDVTDKEESRDWLHATTVASGPMCVDVLSSRATVGGSQHELGGGLHCALCTERSEGGGLRFDVHRAHAFLQFCFQLGLGCLSTLRERSDGCLIVRGVTVTRRSSKGTAAANKYSSNGTAAWRVLAVSKGW